MTNEYLQRAIGGLDRAISLLASTQYAATKTASLVEEGFVNPVQAGSFQHTLDGYSQEQIDLVAHAVAATQPKSASWGTAVLPQSSSEGYEEDDRYASLDAIIMGNVI